MFQNPTQAFPYTIQPYDTLSLLAQRYNTTIYDIASANLDIDLNNLHTGQVIHICPEPEYNYYYSNFNILSTGMNATKLYLNNQFRLLWMQHAVWTRLAIVSIVFDLPDVDFVIKRLLRNPKDFESALKPFYGDQIASQLANLLTNHLVLAAQLVKEAKAGNEEAAAETERRWYENTDKIAAFLVSINPYWSEEEWKSMLYEHLALTKSEAVYMLEKRYEDSITVYDTIEIQALEMADVMVEGIIKQFLNHCTH
ncbi:LysM domain-containing protein [Tissierella sp. MB52-C2]|uniref:LysM peptidoglycan-binding domain-containing protein n=1 Tax=Tissierella sp. MB52-C2 TaxID=3070999 RepID=UPI00280ACF35|nr:LysM domain-containing protein [Tissierella sp. MB52-C2]WMM25647.1 LysM domain-containing protein [Tissierella sp. MB52-C2]